MFSSKMGERSEYKVYLLKRNLVVYTGWICKKGEEKIMCIQICAVNPFEKHHLQG